VKEVSDGAWGRTNRQSLVSALCRRASMCRLRMLSLYHQRQDVARVQEPGKMDDAGRVLPVSKVDM
jgi:hypothetical protein